MPIQPLTAESEWEACLGALPLFALASERVVFVSPHPDDETLAAGGLLAGLAEQRKQVTVVAVTDGENAYAGVRGLGPVRQREQAEALAELGLPEEHLVRLRVEDSAVAGAEELLEDRLYALIPEGGAHVFAPWVGDFHPDHEACGRAARRAAERRGAELSWWFFWSWHRGTPGTLEGLPLRRWPVEEGLLKRKLRALGCHRSQLGMEGQEPILPERLLAPAHRRYEVFALAR